MYKMYKDLVEVNGICNSKFQLRVNSNKITTKLNKYLDYWVRDSQDSNA